VIGDYSAHRVPRPLDSLGLFNFFPGEIVEQDVQIKSNQIIQTKHIKAGI
jgi:hypothetical protein